MDTEILKYILSSQGSVDRGELECNLGDASFIAEVIDSSDKLVACSFSGTERVVARCQVKLCPAEVCPGCWGLHLCKNILFSGACHFLQTRRGCSFPHDLHSEYNMEVLRKFGLESLSRTELCLLLLQSNPMLLPKICHDYNNTCGCWVECQRLHVCERYIRGATCRCTRAHDFSASQPLRLLQEKQIPHDLFKLLKSVYTNKEALWHAEKGNGNNNSRTQANSDGNNEYESSDVNRDPPLDWDSDTSSTVSTQETSRHGGQRRKRGGKGRRQNKQKNIAPSAAAGYGQTVESFEGPNTTGEMYEGNNSDSSSALSTGQSKEDRRGFGARRKRDEICMFFILGHCKHEDSCIKAHDRMPYRWQIKQGAFWTPMADNEMIEQDFCDPHKTNSATWPSVCFDTMKSGHNKVRRQSTVNSVVKPNYSHTTDWLWYWEDKNEQWHQYIPSKHRSIPITSKTLEERFVKNPKDVVTFKAGSQIHELRFQDMTERSLTNQTIKNVRRRPRFVSVADVQAKRKGSTNAVVLPFSLNTQIAQLSNACLTFGQFEGIPETSRTTRDKVEFTSKLPDPFSDVLWTGSQPTTAASTANKHKMSTAPTTNLATSPQVQSSKTSTTTKPVNTVSPTKPQVTSTQFVTLTTSQLTPTMSEFTLTTPQTTSACFDCTTPTAATKSTTASITGTNLANTFSNGTSTSVLTSSNIAFSTNASQSKLPLTVAMWAAQSQTASNISQMPAASECAPPAAATAHSVNTCSIRSQQTATTGSDLANTFSNTASTNASRSKLPLTIAMWATQSQTALNILQTPAAVECASPAAATAHFPSSTLKTSGLKASNPFSTDATASKPQATMATVTPKSQFTPTSPASNFTSSTLSTCILKSPSSTDATLLKSQPMISQATKSEAPTSPAANFTSSTLSTCVLKSPSSTDATLLKSQPMISQATKSAAPTSPTSNFTSSATAGTNSPNAFSTKSQRTFAAESTNPFSPTLWENRSQKMTPATAQSQFTSSRLQSNPFSTDLTPSKLDGATTISATKSASAAYGSNSPHAFSTSSSTKPPSKTAPAFSTTALATTSKLAAPARSPTTTPASAETNPQSTSTRSQTSSATRPEFRLASYSTTSSAANSPRAFSTTAVDSTFPTASASGKTASPGTTPSTSAPKPRSTARNKNSCIIS